MATAFEHLKTNARIISFSEQRRSEIKEQMSDLRAEDKMHAELITLMQKYVCKVCQGEGYVMRPIPGCEIDGPRMHKCDACGGTGAPK